MKPYKINKLERYFLESDQHTKIIVTISFVLLLLVTFLVYITGGAKYVYSHTMYVPLLIVGFSLGLKWGIIFGIIAGIFLGPFMPVDTLTHEKQIFINWFFRLIMFSIVGMFSGYLSSTLKKYLNDNLAHYSHNQETNIPNINSLSNIKSNLDKTKRYLAVSLIINNYDAFFSTLGLDISISLIKVIYDNLKNKLPNCATIVQANNNKFWITIPYNEYDSDLNSILSLLDDSPIVEGIPLYIEYSLGGNKIPNQLYAKLAKSYKKSDNLARLASKAKVPFIKYTNTKLNDSSNSEVEILGSFKKALANDETFLVYHPKIDLRTNKVVGLEALLRWNHPTLGLLHPDQFIPLIEESLLIHDLTHWVLNKAVCKLNELKDNGIDVIMSINVSAMNFYNCNFFERFVQTVEKANILPNQIEMEITESSIMKNPEESQDIFKKLSELGFTISIDDFGKAFSSLTYLGSFKADVLKIDKFFIEKISTIPSLKSIVKYTIDLAHNIGLKVVAEGVETIEHKQILKELDCDYVQGYLYTKPVSPDIILDWCQKNKEFV